MEPHEGRLTLLGSPHAATSPSPVSLAGERPDPRHGPAAEAGQDPTEHARPLAAASGRSRASRSGRAGVAQVRGPGADRSSFETPHSPGPCRTALGHLGRTSGGRGNFLGNGYRGEDGNGELPARRVCRLERHQLKTPERCLQKTRKTTNNAVTHKMNTKNNLTSSVSLKRIWYSPSPSVLEKLKRRML
ncbi:uncharacterized protein LOC123332738 isoform X2 [Bubalus bubalis]|uniref:uncharacterized protein LOC123332738 isoform X2 n=1 Tax=Bubalus bubalis TaxID=89462 RepID=UPI001E1B8293|nr:uncharacterized protein LOC123332738 isoform X2 [Bubalus bubalis]